MQAFRMPQVREWWLGSGEPVSVEELSWDRIDFAFHLLGEGLGLGRGSAGEEHHLPDQGLVQLFQTLSAQRTRDTGRFRGSELDANVAADADVVGMRGSTRKQHDTRVCEALLQFIKATEHLPVSHSITDSRNGAIGFQYAKPESGCARKQSPNFAFRP